MRAVIQRRYGSPDDLALGEVETPVPGEGEVLVRVRAASLHPDVWHMVVGRPWILRLMGGGFLRPKCPIPGTDAAGVVAGLGTGATRFRPGDEVFGETRPGHQWTNGGALADYAVAREEWLERVPEGVTLEEAASVPTAGFIALFNFREAARLRPGDRVLVNGAGGGVGTIALQLAKARGARVTAVDGPSKLAPLRTLGADEVVDYTREDFTRRGERYDIIVDIPGNRPFRDIRRALEPGGRYVAIGHEHYGRAGHRALGLIPHFLALMVRVRLSGRARGPRLPEPTRPEAMRTLAGLLEAGTLRPVVARVFPLAEIREAFRRMVEGEACGRVVVTMSDTVG